MVRDGAAIGEDSPPEALHELRKRGKELRYLLELFGGLFDPEVVKPMVKTLKQLQDVLGDFQDTAVQSELLRDMRDELAAEPDGPAALIALGAVLDALAATQADARAHFGERFAPFAAAEQRALVRDTFPKRRA
jgi:CHAD domain-containing protein